jgi:aspartate/methionine/tyrosine aminotransferase
MNLYVPYNLNNAFVPTTAAAVFARELEAAGRDVYNFGIGQESERAPPSLFPDNITVAHGPRYIGDIGGHMSLRENAATYLSKFMGMGATAANTFVLSQNGRVPLHNALDFFAIRRAANEILLPHMRWQTYDAIVKLTRGLSIKSYSNPNKGMLDQGLIVALEKKPLAMIVNSPHNPSGKIYPPTWMQALAYEQRDLALRDTAAGRAALILDIPYFYALPDTPQGSDHRLDGGYDHLTRPDSLTPWVAIVSFSKALGLAQPGLTFVAVHPELAVDFRKMLLLTGGGSYNAAFFAQVEKAFAPENFYIHEAHYRGLRNKYRTNYEALRGAFGAQIIDGGPGMTALIEVSDLMGKCIKYAGHTYDLTTTAGVVEYIGNTTGVVVVDQGLTERGKVLLRIAAAERPERYAAGITLLANAIHHIQDMPVVRG